MRPAWPGLLTACAVATLGLLPAACGDDDTAVNTEGTVGQEASTTATTAVASTATTAATGGGQLTPSTPMTFSGMGPVRIGMTIDEVRAAAGSNVTVDGGPEDFCHTAQAASAPEVDIVLADDAQTGNRKVIFILNTSKAATTDQGVGTGDTGGEVKAKYPKAQSGSWSQGAALFVAGSPGYVSFLVDADYGHITDASKVTSIVVTRAALATNEEHCA